MNSLQSVVVVRLGHRPGRDARMTTHVGLTARALGADRVVIEGSGAAIKDSIDDVTTRFGGPFTVTITDNGRRFLDRWNGSTIHLTMYGTPIGDVEEEIRAAHKNDDRPMAVVVGAEKVPFNIFEEADWNVAITNQPHSEVGSLAIFLDHLFEGESLGRSFDGGTHRVVPKRSGKRVVPTIDDELER